LKLLQDWLKETPQDNFIFEYYHWKDFGLGNHRLPEIISSDIKELKKIRMRGLLSCQTLRCFYPTGLAMEVLARTLWDHQLKYSDIVDNYHTQAFGEGSGFVKEYFDRLKKFLPEKDFHNDSLWKTRDVKLLKKKIAFLKEKQLQIQEQIGKSGNKVPKLCFGNLSHYNSFATLMEKAGLKFLEGKKKEAISLLEEAKNFLLESEERIENFLDTYLLSGWISIKGPMGKREEEVWYSG